MSVYGKFSFGRCVPGRWGVSVPKVVRTERPEHTYEARAARIQGFTELLVTIGEDGMARDVRVERSLGHGLDEKAFECVRNRRFIPGEKDGDAVPVAANISVGFSLEDRQPTLGPRQIRVIMTD